MTEDRPKVDQEVAAPLPTALDERFELLEPLTPAAWGKRFRGRDRSSGFPVVIRLFTKAADVDYGRRRRFLRTARKLERVDNDNLAVVVGYGGEEGKCHGAVLSGVGRKDVVSVPS